MRFRASIAAGILLSCLERASGQSPSPAAATSPSPTPTKIKTAAFEQRLAAAKTVKVKTEILGISLGTTLAEARRELAKYADAAHPPREEGDGSEAAAEREETEHKVFWELVRSEFATVFLKLDEKDRVTYLQGKFRPGKELPFDKIGEVAKAPIASPKTIAWDVVRANRPLIRVVAEGDKSRATVLTIFKVRRPPER